MAKITPMVLIDGMTGKVCTHSNVYFSQNTSKWLNNNKPTTDAPKGTALYQEAESLKKQLQLSNVRQVIIKYMKSDGMVVLPSEADGNDD